MYLLKPAQFVFCAGSEKSVYPQHIYGQNNNTKNIVQEEENTQHKKNKHKREKERKNKKYFKKIKKANK